MRGAVPRQHARMHHGHWLRRMHVQRQLLRGQTSLRYRRPYMPRVHCRFGMLGRHASNPELSFSWYDAAVLSQKIRQEERQRRSRLRMPQVSDSEELF